jgi:YVTN family beta-propeller protein
MGNDPADPSSDAASTVARLDADTGDVIGQLTVSGSTQVGSGFGVVVIDEEIAWVRNDIDDTLSRVDLATGEVTHTVPVGAGTGDLTIAAGDVWAANNGSNSVTRIDGDSGEVLATIKVGLAPMGIATAAGDVWVGNHRGRPTGSVWRIDAETNEVVARIPVGARQFRDGPSWMTATADALWVGVPNLDAVIRIDPDSSSIVASIPIPDGGVCGRLSADDDAVWLASGLCGDGALTRIDPRTNQVVARISSSHWNSTFTQTTGFGTIWLSTDGGPFEIDPLTNDVVDRLAMAGDISFGGDVAVADGSLWMHDAKSATLLRLEVPEG